MYTSISQYILFRQSQVPSPRLGSTYTPKHTLLLSGMGPQSQGHRQKEWGLLFWSGSVGKTFIYRPLDRRVVQQHVLAIEQQWFECIYNMLLLVKYTEL